MPEAELVVESGGQKGQRYFIAPNDHVKLGRSKQNDICLLEQGVSRFHCRVDNENPGPRIVDLDSYNGTRVNGEMITKHLLSDGDVIELGSLTLRFFSKRQVEQPDWEDTQDWEAATIEGIAHFAESDEWAPPQVTVCRDDLPLQTAVRKTYSAFQDAIPALPTAEHGAATQNLAAICEVSNTLLSSRTLDEILTTAAETILKISGADRSAIVVVDERNREIVPVAKRVKDNLAEGDFVISRTIVDETLRQGVSLISLDVGTDDRFLVGASMVLQNIHSAMCVPLSSRDKVIGALYVDSIARPVVFAESDLGLLAAVGQQAGLAIERACLVADLESLFVGAMRTLIATIEAKDAYTRGHSERVTAFALLIADEMGLSPQVRNVVELGGLLHDVGKIGVPEMILRKPDRLSGAEFAQIQTHPEQGLKIIENMPNIDRIVSIDSVGAAVCFHHEQFDGSGYPKGLAGEAIPLTARILAVADTYDAITSDRSYRKGRDGETAMKIIRECSGTQFDPQAVEAFDKLFKSGASKLPENVSGFFHINTQSSSLLDILKKRTARRPKL